MTQKSLGLHLKKNMIRSCRHSLPPNSIPWRIILVKFPNFNYYIIIQ